MFLYERLLLGRFACICALSEAVISSVSHFGCSAIAVYETFAVQYSGLSSCLVEVNTVASTI